MRHHTLKQIKSMDQIDESEDIIIGKIQSFKTKSKKNESGVGNARYKMKSSRAKPVMTEFEEGRNSYLDQPVQRTVRNKDNKFVKRKFGSSSEIIQAHVKFNMWAVSGKMKSGRMIFN